MRDKGRTEDADTPRDPRLESTFRQWLQQAQAPPDFAARVRARVAQRRRVRSFWAWLGPMWHRPWVTALATGLLFSVSLNTWLGYQVLEGHRQGTAPVGFGGAESGARGGQEPSPAAEPGDRTFTFRGGGPAETPPRPEEVQLPTEAALVQTLIAWAARYNHAGQYARSLPVASAALILDPQAALAFFYRGIAYHEMGQQARAIEDVRRAARLGVAQAHEVLQTWGVD